MAIVRRYSKPDLFLTFTCNPKWDSKYCHNRVNPTTASTTRITSFTVDWVNISKYALLFSITGTHFAMYYSVTSMLCHVLRGLSSSFPNFCSILSEVIGNWDLNQQCHFFFLFVWAPCLHAMLHLQCPHLTGSSCHMWALLVHFRRSALICVSMIVLHQGC